MYAEHTNIEFTFDSLFKSNEISTYHMLPAALQK